jgi:hypothetical protein
VQTVSLTYQLTIFSSSLYLDDSDNYTAKCRVIFCWECKIILNRNKSYEERSRDDHLANCIAKYVRHKRRKEPRLYKVAKRPVDGDEKYRDGWDVDEGFVGTGQEY